MSLKRVKFYYCGNDNGVTKWVVLWFKTQRVKSRNNSCIGVTQENSIEFLIQSSLPFILFLMVCASYCAPYPKQPCVVHEASICCPCCMTSLCSRTFYFLLSRLMISLVTDVTVWLINPNPSCSKNRKLKEKRKENKNKNEKEK